MVVKLHCGTVLGDELSAMLTTTLTTTLTTSRPCLPRNLKVANIRLKLFVRDCPKGRTIRKVMGGGGEITQKKFMQGKMPRKKIHAKEKVKKKNSCRRKVQL